MVEGIEQSCHLPFLVGLRECRCIEALLRKQNGPRLPLKLQAWLSEILRENSNVLQSDQRRVEVISGQCVCPGVGIAEVLGIWVIGNAPFKITLGPGEGGKPIEQPTNLIHPRLLWGLRPVMGQRDEGSGVPVKQSGGMVHDPGRPVIRLGITGERLGAHVRPRGGLINFVVHDPVGDTAVGAIRTGPAIGQQVEHCRVTTGRSLGGQIGHRIDAACFGIRMNQWRLWPPRFIPLIPDEQDRRNDHVVGCQLPQRFVVSVEQFLVDEPGAAAMLKGLPAGPGLVVNQASENDVERGMPDTEIKNLMVGAAEGRNTAKTLTMRCSLFRQRPANSRPPGRWPAGR